MTSRAEYLRAADIARLIGISLRTVRRWIADEIIPSVKLGGSRLVARADLAAAVVPAVRTSEVWQLWRRVFQGQRSALWVFQCTQSRHLPQSADDSSRRTGGKRARRPQGQAYAP